MKAKCLPKPDLTYAEWLRMWRMVREYYDVPVNDRIVIDAKGSQDTMRWPIRPVNYCFVLN